MVEVLYEDNHILVVNKPSGILTQPDDTGRDDLETQSKAYLKRPYLHAIHRLDRQVSGIVLFAKTSKALSRLNKAMRDGQFKKIYHARVDTLPEKNEDTLTHYLIRDDAGTRTASSAHPKAKKSVLHYRVLEGNLLEIQLETGRHHQIRIQLSAIGSPIVGDDKYGSKKKSEKIELSHSKLSFPHPITDQIVTVEL